ncbi:galactose mutarotase [Intrasporangium oryzae NRRL B-24470]|uniref:Galactose mutarotase n=1 Tax=Intrasporangium oryzae NRRL B-24470 TaxID=1386089 RepID=W9G3W3_9MICO|nr:aldose 1-epimerase family protein [Intrasporangium oryzae]EWT00700.1 galactose mutarotase [Intrasporangium oryzae NRRL B-24470]
MSALTPVALTEGQHAHPTGQQWTIGHGPFEATLVEVGGGLRTLTRDGIDLVAGYDVDEPCASGRGQQLMPWPNRIRDGKYTFDGVEHQLPITEVPRGNASHGLVRWALWELVDREESSVTVGYRLHPQPGWDHHLDLRTTYVLDDSGLVVTTAARNVGRSEAPFGYGAHPYLSIGSTPLDDVVLTVPADRWVAVDERLLPASVEPVEGGGLDFRAGRAVAGADLDTAFTGVVRDADGRWRATVASADRTVTLWADEAFPWLQVFTALAREGKGEPGVAVEPMSCPADAFNSGDSLVLLAPGEEWTGTWGITPGPVAG